MSQTLEGLRHKIEGAQNLVSVVRTMKALAASSIGQYEAAVRSLGDYYRTVELGLYVCLSHAGAERVVEKERQADAIDAIVFGSDQGLVGQFNDVLAEFVVETLHPLGGKKEVWAVGERVQGSLEDAGLQVAGVFTVPNSIHAITPLIGQIQIESEERCAKGEYAQLYVFHNRPTTGAGYEPASQRLLPLDEQWHRQLLQIHWPTKNLPEIIDSGTSTLRALVQEYLFVSLFRACAQSLASENASRLAAMQRAEKNIGDLLEDLTRSFHRLRQSSIDEELFDVISGYESLARGGTHAMPTNRMGK